MKHRTFFRRTAALTLLLVLSLSVCVSRGEEPEGTPDEPYVYSDVAQTAIADLFANRQCEYMAAAFLGEREQSDNRSFSAWLYDTTPLMASIWPFLEEIPEEHIFGEYGDLYCVVPLDESACVTVKGVQRETLGNGMQPSYSEPLYNGEVGEPFLLYVRNNDIWGCEPDLVIEYVREDGFVSTWFPEQEAGCVFRPYANGHDCVMDFSLLYDVGNYIPYLDNAMETAKSLWVRK